MTDAIRKGKAVSVTYALHDKRGQIFEQSDIPVPYLHGGEIPRHGTRCPR